MPIQPNIVTDGAVILGIEWTDAAHIHGWTDEVTARSMNGPKIWTFGILIGYPTPADPHWRLAQGASENGRLDGTICEIAIIPEDMVIQVLIVGSWKKHKGR